MNTSVHARQRSRVDVIADYIISMNSFIATIMLISRFIMLYHILFKLHSKVLALQFNIFCKSHFELLSVIKTM